tara:strand:+ start:2921 stop:3499 length:579 start_codon:yes stop_codon:yes gene_type:complete
VSTSYTLENIRKEKATMQLLWIGMVSICMFFAGLTSLVFVDNMEIPSESDWFLYSTVIVLFSSLVYLIVSRNIKRDKPVSFLIFMVFILGLIFTYCQFQGWSDMRNNYGIIFTGENPETGQATPKEHSYFYAITVAHFAHLIFGLIALFITFFNALRNKYSSKKFLGIKLAGTYWHFLTILWVYIYLFINYT